MNFTGKRIMQKTIAVLIVMILTLADFAIVGANVISYAVDMVATNNNNVEFTAYFVNKNEEKVTETDSSINADDLKVVVEVSVKNEGYFNGELSISDASFKFKEDNSSEYVNNVEENKVTLNKISAGTTAVIELGIKYADSEEIETKSLNKDNQINLTGTYINSKKDVNIKGKTSVKINWMSPEDVEAKLRSQILTNSVYNVNETSKRVVQVLVDSALANNSYPVKNTNITLNVPEGVEEVKVHSRTTNATNGNAEFNEENYNYNAEEGTLTINIANKENDGKIRWSKNSKDTLVVTYIYPEEIDLTNTEINVNSTITTYNDEELRAESKQTINEDIDGIVTNEIVEREDSIYKGKLYTGEERDYNTTTVVNVDYCDAVDKIEVSEKKSVFVMDEENKKANIEYKQSRINKSDFLKIFGEDGSISILDQDETVIADINKDSETDDNGYIIINYNTGVTSIKVKTSKPGANGILNIEHKKAILDSKLSRDDIKNITAIKEEVKSNSDSSTKIIELKETSSDANIKINKQKLSTITKNDNVEIVATLETNGENKDLYKNPTVTLVFPKEITEVNITQATALYRNGLEVKNYSQSKNDNGNIVVNVEFKGEQTKYNSEILNGLELHFFASIVVDKSIPSKDVTIKMNYTNENGIKDSYEASTKVHLESQYGLMLYNKVTNYNSKNEVIETTDDSKVEAKLDMNKSNVSATVTTSLINNYSKDLKDVEVIGRIPSEDDTNTFNTSIQDLKVDNDNAKVLYSKKADAKSDDKSWTKNSEDAKSYKIVLDSVEAGEVTQVTYSLNVANNLSYNATGNLTTVVDYDYADKDLTKTSNISLLTEKATIKEETTGTNTAVEEGLNVNISAVSGSKELKDGDSVYNGETIRYTIKITNNTGKDYTDVTVKATQTNGKIFDLVEQEVYNPYYNETSNQHYWTLLDSNEITLCDKKDIANGDTVTLEYQTVANKESDTNSIIYGDVNITSNELNKKITTIKNDIKDAELQLTFGQKISEECVWYSNTIQTGVLKITNTSNNELKDVKIQINLLGKMNCEYDGTYINGNSNATIENINKVYNKELNQTIITLTLKSINAGSIAEIEVKPYISLENVESGKTSKLEIYATATTSSNKTYTSNSIIREALQIGKKIEVTQIAKINDKTITESSVAKNSDTIEFYITVKNEELGKVNLYLQDSLPSSLNVKNVTLVKSDKSTVDITSSCNNQYLEYNLELNSDEEVGIIIKSEINTSLMNDKDKVRNNVSITESSSSVIYSDSVEFGIEIEKKDDGKLNLTAIQEAEITDGSTIKDGDKVEYTIKLSNTGDFDRTVNIYDYINTSITDVKVSLDNKDVTKQYVSDNDLEIENYTIKANSNTDIKIEGIADLTNYKESSIENSAIVKSSIADTKSNTITYYTAQDNSQDENNEENNNQNNNEDQSITNVRNYTVSGKAWIDNNENGKRDDNEEAFKDMTVRAINTETKEVLTTTATTGEDGSYQLTLPEGKYLIVFMYNNDDYYVTTYQAKKVNDDVNSDAVSKTLNIDGTDKTVGSTDVINLSSNKDNIDIGLIFRNKFDLKLEKSVTKVVVTNDGGTSTYDFDDSELAKVEIHSKYLSSSQVVVEYKIKVTNVGDIDGYVKNIVDYMPKDLTFSSNLNKEWYQSGNYLYNESVADTKLAPGESTEVTLILTKTMTESNTGLVNNTAAIKSSYNSKSFSDADSDNNNGSADVIISVKTGAAIRLALLTLSLTIVIAGIAYFITKKYIYNKI